MTPEITYLWVVQCGVGACAEAPVKRLAPSITRRPHRAEPARARAVVGVLERLLHLAVYGSSISMRSDKLCVDHHP